MESAVGTSFVNMHGAIAHPAVILKLEEGVGRNRCIGWVPVQKPTNFNQDAEKWTGCSFVGEA